MLVQLLLSIELGLGGQRPRLSIHTLEDTVSSLTVALTRVPPYGFLGVQIVIADDLLSLEPREDGEGSLEGGVSTSDLGPHEVLLQGKEWIEAIIPWELSAIGSVWVVGEG